MINPKPKIALYGGAFNPPTNGHLQVAKYVLNSDKGFDEVWLMPCYSHMYDKDLLDADKRLLMCRMAAEVDRRIKTFDYEIKNQFKGATYCILKRFLQEPLAKEYDFSYIIGMDNALTFNQWVNYKELQKMIPFIIVPRRGYSETPLSSKWFLKPPHIFLGTNNNPIEEVSSTEVRNCIYAKAPIKGMVCPEVEDYIKQHNLYGD